MNKWTNAFCIFIIGVYFYWSAENSGYQGSFFRGLYEIFGSRIFLLLGVMGALWEVFELGKKR